MHILIINAHQYYDRAPGKLNKSIVEFMTNELKTNGHTVTITNIEEGYDLKEEVQKHVEADIIITQSPVYWFGSPWIHKKYIDEVLCQGAVNGLLFKDDGRTRSDPTKQYGTGGNMLNKRTMLSVTWNAPEIAFNNKDQYMFGTNSVDEVMIALTNPYKFCGALPLPAYAAYDVLKSDLDFDIITNDLKQHLQKHIQYKK
eukprot:GHVR01178959.1.p1 GENE.GHVR01178959.1~~GHVR01178959.1.p1  ORF type:complete len:200 (+),score=40.58 GHVR01178959.1:195-794(+)